MVCGIRGLFWGAGGVTESVVFSGLFVFLCVFAEKEAKARGRAKSLEPTAPGMGTPALGDLCR